MADSLRLQVLKALTTHLEGVAKEDGYNYDLDGAVFRGRGRFGDGDPDVMVSILENPRPDFGNPVGDGTTRHEMWPLLIQGWCPDDAENPSDPVYGLLDDVERRLMMLVAVNRNSGNPVHPDLYLLGRTVTDIALTPGVVRPPTDGISSRAFFYLPVRVGLATEYQ